MNWSIQNASAHTHLKIVAIALLAAMAVVWGGLAAHLSTMPGGISASHSVLSR
jgi:hypothetical protein